MYPTFNTTNLVVIMVNHIRIEPNSATIGYKLVSSVINSKISPLLVHISGKL
jgi:hypothetical protein